MVLLAQRGGQGSKEQVRKQVLDVGSLVLGVSETRMWPMRRADVSTHGAMQPADFPRDVGGDGVIESTVEQEDYLGAFLIFCQHQAFAYSRGDWSSV